MNLCACINENTIKKCVLVAKNINADLFEHRIDYLKKFDNLKELYSLNKNFIATCRNTSCGGKFSKSEDERIDVLLSAIDAGAKMVDIEIETQKLLIEKVIKHAKSKNVKVIISMHNFKTTPTFEELRFVLEKEKELGADIGKIVCYANNRSDANNLLSLINEGKNIGLPLVAFGMGEEGKFSRIASLIYGSPFTFVSTEKNTAPGQINITQISKVLGVIGNPIEHSKSPLIHNVGLKKQKLDYIYFALRIENINEAIRAMRKLNFKGYSVTIPHKTTCMSQIDKIDSLAKQIGAVNTIVNDKGVLTGYNTDYIGAINALKEKTTLTKKEVYIIGTGGAARAVIAGLVKEKAIVTIFGRNRDHAIDLAEEFSCKHGTLQEINQNYDILINSTPVGMYPDIEDMPVPESILVKGKIVFDVVYNPLKTELLKQAEKKGCKIISGVEMFLEQAYAQFELFTGVKAPKNIMRRVLLSELKKEQSVRE